MTVGSTKLASAMATNGSSRRMISGHSHQMHGGSVRYIARSPQLSSLAPSTDGLPKRRATKPSARSVNSDVTKQTRKAFGDSIHASRSITGANTSRSALRTFGTFDIMRRRLYDNSTPRTNALKWKRNSRQTL